MAQSPRAERKRTESSQFHHRTCLTRPMAAPGPARFRTAHLALAALMLLAPLFAHAAVIFVDGSAGGANNGSTWADAYTDLQDGLAHAEIGDEIWVAAGVYKPEVPEDPANVEEAERGTSFQLRGGVEVYGGFAGTETQRNRRDPQANLTVLSGDIDNNDTTDDDGVVVSTGDIAGSNSFHVTTDNTQAVLDGFTITAGNANGRNNTTGGGMLNVSSSPDLTNIIFIGNNAESLGGGMHNRGSSPVLTNVSFIGNSAADGGGMFNNSSSTNLILTNVSFSGNSAINGGGIYNNSTNLVLTNVSFSGNNAVNEGGGMFNEFDITPDIRNSIFWNNQDSSGTGTPTASIANTGSTPTLSYSLVEGCNSDGSWEGACGNDGGNNLPDVDPLFVTTPNPSTAPTSAGNLRLQRGSPVIDAGNDEFISDIDNATDLDGNPRKAADAVDLGPFEFPDLLFKDRFEVETP